MRLPSGTSTPDTVGLVSARPVGRLVAAGRSAEVYDAGTGLVLRRRTDGGHSEQEADVMRWAEAHGVPVPHVESAEGPDLVMAVIDGPTLLGSLVADPSRAVEVGRTLARLHRLLDEVPAPDWLAGHGRASGPGPTTAVGDAGRADTAYLLHGDLHPGNVIDSPDGPVLIDWTNASAGARALDVAESWLLISAYDPGLGEGWMQARRELADALLSGAGGLDPAALRAVAAERLRDVNTSDAERAAIAALVPVAD
jgi:aminoglycoside phosphotransferase (APT) family kinase protein